MKEKYIKHEIVPDEEEKNAAYHLLIEIKVLEDSFGTVFGENGPIVTYDFVTFDLNNEEINKVVKATEQEICNSFNRLINSDYLQENENTYSTEFLGKTYIIKSITYHGGKAGEKT